jgi:hypothetical protein
MATIPVKFITFNYKRHRGIMHIWQYKDKWQWSALGNSGEEETEEKAIAAARSWITEDYNGTMKRRTLK